MKMTLRPGEALVWRWGHLKPGQAPWRPDVNPNYPDNICNGLWEYRPDFSRRGAGRRARRRWSTSRSGPDGVRAEDGQAGHDRLDDAQPLRVRRGAGWKRRAAGPGSPSRGTASGGRTSGSDLDPFFPPEGAARYQYQLRCRLSGPARLRHLARGQRPADGAAHAARAGGRRERLHLHRQVPGRAEGADHPRVGGALRLQAPRGPARGDPSPGRRRGRAARTSSSGGPLPKDSRRRADRRLPLRARRPSRHAVAALHELRQAHLPDGRSGQGAVHLARSGAADGGQDVLLAGPRQERRGSLGAVGQDLELHPAGPGLSPRGDRRTTTTTTEWGC